MRNVRTAFDEFTDGTLEHMLRTATTQKTPSLEIDSSPHVRELPCTFVGSSYCHSDPAESL